MKATVAGVTTAFVGGYYEWTSNANTLYYSAGGARVAMRRTGYTSDNGLFWIMGDHLGSTSIVANADGSLKSMLLYKAWGELRYSSGVANTKYTFTGQYQHVSDFGLMYYVARWYDPALGRFAQADTVGEGDRYAYVNNNPVRFNDPTGHYGRDVHYDMTYNMMFAAAFGQAMTHNGFRREEAMAFAGSLAPQVAQADLNVDQNYDDNSIIPPGTYTPQISADSSSVSVSVNPWPTTLHWYTTPQAEDALVSSNTPEEFGRAMHGYQDSYSHWQKLGEPETPGEIWEGHAKNDLYKPCEITGICDPHNSVDFYDPTQNPVNTEWAEIDARLQEGMSTYINDFVDEQWEDWNEN